ncbi:hypothetical protein Tco_0902109 [Tanacetum coccineum]
MVLENNKNIDDVARNVAVEHFDILSSSQMMMMKMKKMLLLMMLLEDEEDPAAPHPSVIVIPSDDEVDEKEVKTPVSVIGRKCVYALIDESDNDEEYWSNAFLF